MKGIKAYRGSKKGSENQGKSRIGGTVMNQDQSLGLDQGDEPGQQKQPGQPGQLGQEPQPQQHTENTQHLNWVVTKGAKHIDNIIRIRIFRHYEHKISTYKLLLLGYLDKRETQLGILEAEETFGVYNGIMVSPLLKHWEITTCLFRKNNPCIIVIAKIEDDLILMSHEEFEFLTSFT